MNEKILIFNSKKAGPTSIILAGVHGNEKSGIKALESLIPLIKITKGRVIVGFGNPRAIKQNKRFIEADLNRMFKPVRLLSKDEKKSYEYKRAKFLKKYLNQADALLDVHANQSLKSRPFVISESNSNELVKFLPVTVTVSGFDKIQPGGTDYYMNTNGKKGICVECGYLTAPSTTNIAKESILKFLQARGHIKTKKLKTYNQSRFRVYNMYTTKTDKFILAKAFGDFEKIARGQVIGTDGKIKVKAPEKSLIIFPRDRNKIGTAGFLLAK